MELPAMITTMMMWSRKPANNPWLAGISCILLFLAHPASAEAQDGGPSDNRHVRVGQILGTNVKSIAKNGKEKPVKSGDELEVGDSIETGDRTLVKLNMFDGSVLTVGQNSQFKLEALRGDPNTIVHWTFRLIQGAVRGTITERESQKPKEQHGVKLTVETPIAAMGVRGTKFIYTQAETGDKARTEVYTEHGEVLFSPSKDFPKNNTVAVNEGTWSYYEKKIAKPPAAKKFSADGELKGILEKHGFNLADRSPQSVGSAAAASAKPTVPMEKCIETKMGWKQSPDSYAPVGECY